MVVARHVGLERIKAQKVNVIAFTALLALTATAGQQCVLHASPARTSPTVVDLAAVFVPLDLTATALAPLHVNHASLGRSKVLPGSLRASRVLPVPTAAAAGQWHALRARPARFKAAPVKRIAACALLAHLAAVGSRCARFVQPVRIP
jgi:hypothetical protein